MKAIIFKPVVSLILYFRPQCGLKVCLSFRNVWGKCSLCGRYHTIWSIKGLLKSNLSQKKANATTTLLRNRVKLVMPLLVAPLLLNTDYMAMQSTGLFVKFLRLDSWNRSRWRVSWFFYVYSASSLCFSVSVVIMGFYLFPWHTDEGFHRDFVASHTISVWHWGENFSMTGISIPSSHSPTPLPFCFSLNILIVIFSLSFRIFLPDPQHCSLMFTYSLIQNNKLLWMVSVLPLVALMTSSTKKKLQNGEEMKWHIENAIIVR